MKITFFLLFFGIIFAGSSYATETTETMNPAQDKTITGTVTDESGDPLIGVSVVEVGTSNGTATDVNGRYSLRVSQTGSLRFIYLSYVTQEQKIDSRNVINVILKEESQKLDEVVVVGYGVQRKSDVTGSISVASGADILATPSFNALEGLRGKAAGVNIFVNTGNPLGVDETGPRVIIRGINSISTNTDPLYVVDGVQMNELQYINPNNIERMEVLKDASATAIYGARGANGVILITTKRGQEGEGVTVSYDGWIKVRTLAKKVDLLNASEFMQVEETGFSNIGKYDPNSPYIGLKPNRSDPMLFDGNGNPLYDTDWQDEATRTSFSQNHQLSIQQKNKISSVGAFFNYSDEEGIMLNNYAKRLNAKMVYDANAKKWLTTNMNIEINHMWGNGIDDSGGGQVARRTIWEMPPILPVKFPDGTWANSQFTGNLLNYGLEAMANPVHELTTRKRNRFRSKIFGNLALIFHLAEGLDLRTQAGIDANIRSNKNYDPNDLINISAPNGRASQYKGERMYWQEETYLSYNRLFNNIHRINATLGMSWSQYTESWDNTNDITGFSTNFFGYDNLGAGTTPSAPTSGWSRWAMNSYFGRVSYGLKDRYLLTATLRVDGSSRFGKNNQYGTFPSAGLGWILSNEPFMKGKATWIDNLKLHTSYGRTGNSEIDPYTSLATLSSGTILLNGTRVPANQLSQMPNPNLKWEKTDQFDIGINLNLFKNRLNVDFDYYYKKTSDLLLSRPLPFTTGFSSVMDNIGRVDNQGIDLLVNTLNVKSKTFSWESTINLNYNKNEIKKLGENNEDIITDPGFVGGNVILRVGEPLGSFYGYRRLGTWGTDEAAEAAKVGAIPGEARRSDDREIIGNGLPKVTGSFINKFYYKNFDLTVDLQFVAGVDSWQLFLHSTEDRTGIANSLKSALTEAWTPENQHTMVQQIRQQNYSGQNTNADSHWVADGSYLRGNLIQLGYTIDHKLLTKWNLKRLHVNLSVSNVFLIHSKDFKGYDPEGTSSTARFGQNIFFFEYPRSRDYSLGLNLSF
ncbi:MAG: TonB-dependent receptor [Candidatus Azobacteroides sp.]|nr:TonB-dependent receptor [Candidatus Azobacteroides sp.]